ncbi:MAG TPA: D-aminoacylase [Acidimicrobiales bacterium]|nr:D-aminoacylase [Acidimicrobiales bacterium]
MSRTVDLIIRGGEVYDGTGAPPVRADVAVVGDRITDVGVLGDDVSAATVIDATGLAVTPGFIDVHAHDDAEVLIDPTIACKTSQGVTTDVVGNCGLGIAPHATGAASFAEWAPGLDTVPPWDGFTGYVERLDTAPPGLNVAVLVGHGTVRSAVLGTAERAPTATELDRMRGLVDEGMAAGCVGLSTGLIYEPGRYADTDEIVALADVVAAAGGIYTTHMRNEADQLLESVAEAIEIGERAGLPVQISHHKASGKANWGKVHESLAMIAAARDRGVAVSVDQYPYTAGSTHLFAVVQNGALDDGKGGIGKVEPGDVTVASAADHPEWEGLNLDEIGELLAISGRAAADAVLDGTRGRALVVLEMMSEADVRTVLAYEHTMIGSDGVPAPGKPHPRLWGTFPRVLGHYGRDEGVLTFADAVRRMTSLPAQTFGLTDRGVVRVGAFADLVVLDPATIADTATYRDPEQPSAGIHSVIVNGRTDGRAGRPLRRS